MSSSLVATGVQFPDSTTQTTAATGFGFKNRIINGAMMIDQRNAGASVTPTGTAYVLDRWQVNISQSSKFSVQQTPSATETGYATRVAAGFSNYLAVTSLSSYTVGASELFVLRQKIEGFNFADMAWGTSNAKSATLSFLVYSSLTGTFGGALINSAQSRSYPFSYTVSAANTWTQVSITVAGDTSGTWVGATNGTGLEIDFSLGAGSTFSGAAGSWSSNYYVSTTGATSVVGTSGATFYITGVQLEKGSTATSFDYRPYGTELALCQRYLPAWRSSGTFDAISVGLSGSTIGFYAQITYQVAPRVPPTGVVVSSASHFTANSYGTGGGTPSSVVFSSAGSGVAVIQLVTTGLTVGQSGNVAFNNASGYLYLTGCEL